MEKYLEQMKKFIAYHSISTDEQYKNDMSQTANYLIKLLNSHGCETQSITGYGNPIVVASYVVDKKLPTCLVYGHYDVQPADISE
jgi:acetylornithine deacetylase/succinyl-diaminopimelate desuccinylase-like protein